MPRIRRPAPSPDRVLHQLVRFARFPSESNPRPDLTRGQQLSSYLRKLFGKHSSAFAHDSESQNPVQTALLSDDLSRTVRLLTENPELASRPNLLGQTVLHQAVMTGRLDAAQRLIEYCDVLSRDTWGNTPLHWAAFINDDVMGDLLLKADADTEAKNDVGAQPGDHEALVKEEEPGPDLLVQEPDSDSITAWPAKKVEERLGFRPRLRSFAGNDFLYDLFVRCRVSFTVRERLEVLDSLPEPARMFLKHYGEPLRWGVALDQDLKRGAFIGSYVGSIERLSPEDEDALAYASEIGPLTDHLRCVIVGHKYGSILTRANSSRSASEANMKIRFGWYRGEPMVNMFAKRDLERGTQLLWYYGEGYWKPRDDEPVASEELR